ncbi:hypothetical protein TNIN_226731 [Trichonephila inaurata madagascariensis]|uniref:Uncharacterized protein n=1 Tax=Trichonephila inaurata madagascariensis TaxID=2747483 RepID=A0A8X6XZT2_9ARAC|nr:hypothetical protein TNIN_226731 [Trichonephila inaurata madagascariensis]
MLCVDKHNTTPRFLLFFAAVFHIKEKPSLVRINGVVEQSFSPVITPCTNILAPIGQSKMLVRVKSFRSNNSAQNHVQMFVSVNRNHVEMATLKAKMQLQKMCRENNEKCLNEMSVKFIILLFKNF